MNGNRTTGGNRAGGRARANVSATKAAAQVFLLAAGTAMMAFGLWRGEGGVVLAKAVKLCLECVGIG